jgi:hypothetical protein
MIARLGNLTSVVMVAVRNTRWKIKCDKTVILVMCAVGARVFAETHVLVTRSRELHIHVVAHLTTICLSTCQKE